MDSGVGACGPVRQSLILWLDHGVCYTVLDTCETDTRALGMGTQEPE